MATSEYYEARDFLHGLDNLFVENDKKVMEIWTDKKLPLFRTKDFETNWRCFQDETGEFIDKNGARFRVEPQSHFVTQCDTIYQQGSVQRLIKTTYAAILVAKITWKAFRRTLTAEEERLPGPAKRQAFIDRFLRKIPYEWREIILIRDLHLEEDEGTQWSSVGNEVPSVYSKLASPTNIRVVSIQSALEAYEPIRCSLREERLDSNPQFQALSYVWGSPLARRDIILDGVSVSVTENLYFALECLRQRSCDRIMWIDAICINQSDLDERQNQVAQMDAIYKQATEVVVWLGPETETSSTAFKILELVLQQSGQFREEFQSMPLWNTVEYPMAKGIFFTQTLTGPMGADCPECRETWLSDKSLSVNDKRSMQEMAQNHNRKMHSIQSNGLTSFIRSSMLDGAECFLKLLQRPYWRRTWVLQEAILAKKLTVQCGRKSVDWGLLFNGIFLCLRLLKKTCWGQQPFTPGRAFDLMTKTGQHISEMFPFVFLLQSNTTLAETLGPNALAMFLTTTAGSQATDPRDKIYGLLGLLPQGSTARIQLQPNYSQPTKRLFISVARYLLDTMEGLEMLTARPWWRIEAKTGIVRGLPSWAPDWTAAPGVTCNVVSLGVFSTFHSRRVFRGEVQPEAADVSHDASVYAAGLGIGTYHPRIFSCFDEVFSVHGLEVDSIVQMFHGSILGQRAGGVNQPTARVVELITQQVREIEKKSWEARWHACRDVWSGLYEPTGQTLREAFWRTACLDRFYDTFGNSPKLMRIPPLEKPMDSTKLFNHYGKLSHNQSQAGCHFPPETQKDEEWLLNYLSWQLHDGLTTFNTDFHGACLSFFVTQSGYIGLGHPALAVGDTIAVLLGSSVPHILRKHDKAYMLVGEW
ncbi:uncharacterized protein PG998_010133 [Apiospora kogelbergensis]|uniref:Heterokaryon incompatibility domain-containing protein n=1 Tax=Apiospora kogelbergensis TaxID=1337665 RepID=A0AAW0RA01_9PEZI